jgi:hypothetical protein
LVSVIRRRRTITWPGADECPLALPGDDAPVSLQQAICALDDAKRHVEILNHRLVGGELVAWLKLTTIDGLPVEVGHLNVGRSRVIRVQFPHVSNGIGQVDQTGWLS